jgi:hypothetical protein
VGKTKKIMSDVFITLHQGFDEKSSYTGKQVMSAVKKVMKRATEAALSGGDAPPE